MNVCMYVCMYVCIYNFNNENNSPLLREHTQMPNESCNWSLSKFVTHPLLTDEFCKKLKLSRSIIDLPRCLKPLLQS